MLRPRTQICLLSKRETGFGGCSGGGSLRGSCKLAFKWIKNTWNVLQNQKIKANSKFIKNIIYCWLSLFLFSFFLPFYRRFLALFKQSGARHFRLRERTLSQRSSGVPRAIHWQDFFAPKSERSKNPWKKGKKTEFSPLRGREGGYFTPRLVTTFGRSTKAWVLIVEWNRSKFRGRENGCNDWN